MEEVLADLPALYVVATPLGNLGDISSRALGVLRQVSFIGAEDTRHSQKLLDAYGITTRMVAVHEHNEQEGASRLLHALESGEHVALITDAGTPAISDPGAKVVRRVQEAGFRVVPVPGACAAAAALSVAGVIEGRFLFAGFLPPKTGARRQALEELKGLRCSLVVYESPHRIVECVEDMASVLEGQRELVICRELTKRFEQIERIPLDQALVWLQADANRQRGEFVLILSGAPPEEGLSVEAQRVLRLLMTELPLKSAARMASEITGAPKNQLYALALSIKDGA